MKGIPGPILNKMRKIMLECGPFDSNRQLFTLFSDDRISAWRSEVPEADNRQNRVDYFVSTFYKRYNRVGQNVLVLFLQTLYDKESSSNPEDLCVDRLYDIAIEMADIVNSNLPPLTRNNLVRASFVRGGEMPDENMASYSSPTVEPDINPFSVSLPTYLSTNSFAEPLESLKNRHRADWLPVNFLKKGLTAASGVGRVEFQGKKIGTAFLVAPKLVLTNAHVVEEIPNLVNGGVRFNIGLDVMEQWHYFSEIIVDSQVEDLDFVLIRLETSAIGDPLTISNEQIFNKQAANILQYPRGERMQVALRYNAIVHADETRFYYVADTADGSSGSPIFDDNWRVIGLHRAGVVNKDRSVKNANQGVPILAIKPYILPYF